MDKRLMLLASSISLGYISSMRRGHINSCSFPPQGVGYRGYASREENSLQAFGFSMGRCSLLNIRNTQRAFLIIRTRVLILEMRDSALVTTHPIIIERAIYRYRAFYFTSGGEWGGEGTLGQVVSFSQTSICISQGTIPSIQHQWEKGKRHMLLAPSIPNDEIVFYMSLCPEVRDFWVTCTPSTISESITEIALLFTFELV